MWAIKFALYLSHIISVCMVVGIYLRSALVCMLPVHILSFTDVLLLQFLFLMPNCSMFSAVVRNITSLKHGHPWGHCIVDHVVSLLVLSLFPFACCPLIYPFIKSASVFIFSLFALVFWWLLLLVWNHQVNGKGNHSHLNDGQGIYTGKWIDLRVKVSAWHGLCMIGENSGRWWGYM